MPKYWLYYIALLIPFLAGVLIYRTSLVEWCWYQGHEQAYYTLASLRQNHLFQEFIGGWAFPVLLMVIGGWWKLDDTVDHGAQFLLTPLIFVPIAIVVNIGATLSFDSSILYAYPLVILPLGYLYVLVWVVTIWVFEKLRIVM